MTEKNLKYEAPGKIGLNFFYNCVDTATVVGCNGLTQTDRH